MFELILPKLPSHIVTKLRLLSNTLAHNDSDRQWLNDFHMHKVNVVNHSFYKLDNFTDEITELYSKYFNDSIVPYLGVLRNVNDSAACLPTHFDYQRYLAINYYIDLGGNNVRTCFYGEDRIGDISAPKHVRYDEFVLTEEFKFKKDHWYGYSVQRCHSVENIETTRIFLILLPESNPNYIEFSKKYKNLIKE
jgi:hypothetical protein